jgi:threonine/homoserine/homoserine lactone efflux protein
MGFNHWLAFAATCQLLLILPGPTVLLVVSYALGHGRRSAAATVAGVALGDFTAMTASMAGLGAMLAASSAAFTALRLVGAAYLVFLGVRLWRAPAGNGALQAPPETRGLRMLAHAFAVTALNPKSIVFFIAFVPQFLVLSRPLLPQIVVLELTFLALAILNAGAYAMLAAAARRSIRRPKVQRLVNRVGGSVLVGASALAAGWRGANA